MREGKLKVVVVCQKNWLDETRADCINSLNLNDELKRLSQFHCDLVFGYFRQHDKDHNINTPEGVIKICLLFAFRLSFKSTILSPDECEKLQQMIGKHRNEYASEWKLLYRGSRDGYKKKDCHRRCYSHLNVVLIVESKKGNVFGGFTQIGWDLFAKTDEHRTDPHAFCFDTDGQGNTVLNGTETFLTKEIEVFQLCS